VFKHYRILALCFSLVSCFWAGAAFGQSDNVDELARKGHEPPTGELIRAPTGSQAYNGTNVGGPEWTRPFADGTCCSGLGPVRYSVQEFHISANDTCDFNSIQDGWDGYLLVYRSPFDPLNQTVNFVAGDDDGDGGIGTSDIAGVAIDGQTTYIVVTTGFENGEEGTFTNTINCAATTVNLGPFAPAAPRHPIPVNDLRALLTLAALALAFGVMAIRSRAQ
jgi:hypothetical protein